MQPSCLFTRKAWQGSGPLDESLNFALDVEYWIRIASKFRFKRLPDILSITLSHPNAKTTSMLNRSLAEVAILCIKHGEIDYAKRTLDIILYGYREGLGCKIKKNINKLLRKSKQFMHR